jgi:hypothetical protein
MIMGTMEKRRNLKSDVAEEKERERERERRGREEKERKGEEGKKRKEKERKERKIKKEKRIKRKEQKKRPQVNSAPGPRRAGDSPAGQKNLKCPYMHKYNKGHLNDFLGPRGLPQGGRELSKKSCFPIQFLQVFQNGPFPRFLLCQATDLLVPKKLRVKIDHPYTISIKNSQLPSSDRGKWHSAAGSVLRLAFDPRPVFCFC